MLGYDEDRTKWLESLKEGDEVACDVGRYGNVDWRILQIKKITSTGKIRLNGLEDILFDKNGEGKSGGSGAWRQFYQISPITDYIKNWVLKRNLVLKLKDINLKELSIEQLQAIEKIINLE